VNALQIGPAEIAENRVTSVTAELLTTPASQARVSAVDVELLATPPSEARITSIVAEAPVSVAEVPDGPASSRAIIMILGG
jgi:hypothetical protein